jgi:hypothetical protein
MSQNLPRKPQRSSRARNFDFNVFEPLAKWINSKIELEEHLTANFLRKLVFLMFLCTIYIFFQHNFDKLIRNLNNTEQQVKERKAAYISHKSKYLFASKQSEVEKKLEGKGFEKSNDPPIKISAYSTK